MELKAVRRVSMCDLGFEIGWKVDDIDSAKRAFFWTDTTSNTQCFTDESDFGIRGNLDTKSSASNHRTTLFALLPAFFWFALVGANNGDTGKLISHL